MGLTQQLRIDLAVGVVNYGECKSESSQCARNGDPNAAFERFNEAAAGDGLRHWNSTREHVLLKEEVIAEGEPPIRGQGGGARRAHFGPFALSQCRRFPDPTTEHQQIESVVEIFDVKV